MRRGHAVSVISAALALALLAPPAASAAVSPPTTFATGFTDGSYLDPVARTARFGETAAAGAQFIVLPVDWGAIEPNAPDPTSDQTDPSNPAYSDWWPLDQAIRGATVRGLKVVLTVVSGAGSAPAWAGGPNPPSSVDPGIWYPSPVAYRAFATAVARRYSGSYNAGSGVLPRVRYFEAWSEPNLADHLQPQWIRQNGQWMAESPVIYRSLVNALYAAVKGINPADRVIAGATAPWGDPPGGDRIPPAEFIADMLCLKADSLAPQSCPDPPHFDILSHHPYELGGPYLAAYNPDDVSLPDFWKLTRALDKAERTGRVLPHGPKQLWITEFGWESNPPDRYGIPVMQRAYWTEESFYEVWREGVDALAWLGVQDFPPTGNPLGGQASGLYYSDGTRKPGFEAFRFPFLAAPARRGREVIWGISPVAGTVSVQRLVRHRWVTLLKVRAGAHGIFTRTIRLRRRWRLRAAIGRDRSLTWPES